MERAQDQGSNQTPMRGRLGAKFGCVSVAVLAALTQSLAQAYGCKPFHFVPSFQGTIYILVQTVNPRSAQAA
jgi:hypothetical protein